MNFEDVIGQDALKSHIKSAISLGKVSHAYIINGEAGYGKMKLAEAFAKTLLCSNVNSEHDEDQMTFFSTEVESKVPEDINPCGECTSCKKADHHNHPDIIYISHEKPNLISASEIREQLVDTVDILPYESKRKVYIIDDAEYINETGQNIVLKTIEEPPEYVVIIILTTNKDKLLPTVLSRCVNLYMTPVEDKLIKKYLMDKGIVDYQASMAVSFAQGNPGKALMIASDPQFQTRRKTVIDIMSGLGSFQSKEMSDIATRLEEDKENIDTYLQLMVTFLRDVLVYKTTGDESRINFKQELPLIRELSDMSLSKINNMISIVNDGSEKIRFQVTFGLTIEMMLLKMKESL